MQAECPGFLRKRKKGLFDNAFVEAYKNLYLKWTEDSQVVHKHKEIIELLV